MSQQMPNILVVDDDPTIVDMIYDGLIAENFNVITASNPQEAKRNIAGKPLDFALLDLDLGWGNITGIELGRELVLQYPDLVVIIMTGYHNLKFAVQAMREQSFHYMIKPFRIDQIISLTERAQRELKLKRDNERLKNEISELKKELQRLNELISQIRPEEAGLSYGSRDKKHISNPDALNSYKRQKNTSYPNSDKKE